MSSTPCSAQTPGVLPLSLPHSSAGTGGCSTATPAASLLCRFSLEAWKYGHTPSASPRSFSPSPAPSASTASSQRHLVLWDPPRERKCSMENLHPIEIFWERSARTASCHVMNLVHPELRDVPARPAKGFQSCTPRPRPRLCTLMPPCPCVSLSHPVAPRTLRACGHPGLDLWSLGGDQEPITSPLAVPSHRPCLGSCVTYASTSVSPPVSLLSWARGGWVCVGDTPWDPPPVPMAGLRAAAMYPPQLPWVQCPWVLGSSPGHL